MSNGYDARKLLSEYSDRVGNREILTVWGRKSFQRDSVPAHRANDTIQLLQRETPNSPDRLRDLESHTAASVGL